MEKKCRGSHDQSVINLLPEPIIQHIQSFLNRKEAARTTVVSKPWYTAWLTRPALDFDERDFNNNLPRFQEFTIKTMQRYGDLNLKIECLRLHIERRESELLAHALIASAIKLGATDLKLDHKPFLTIYVPREVLESESIVRLSLSHASIPKDSQSCCSSLKSLDIHWPNINLYDADEVDVALGNIISSCRASIEHLTLSFCRGFTSRWKCPHDELLKLRTLYLDCMRVDDTLFNAFATRFPCLKELSLVDCRGYKSIEMASNSLECIRIVQPPRKRQKDKFDVPNIRKFTYSCTSLPSLNIIHKGTREWEFDLSIKCPRLYAASWFRRLSSFFKRMRTSRIKLTLLLKSGPRQSKCDGVDNIIPKRVVLEDLTIEAPSEHCSALLVRLFGICCPKSITQYWLPESSKDNNELLRMLCNVLLSAEQKSFGLKQVNMEIYEEILRDEWSLLVLGKPLDASKAPPNRHKVRFPLRWG